MFLYLVFEIGTDLVVEIGLWEFVNLIDFFLEIDLKFLDLLGLGLVPVPKVEILHYFMFFDLLFFLRVIDLDFRLGSSFGLIKSNHY